ncbi:MAG: serine/threonine-protein kinase [Phycisphaerae bacterium]
MAHEADDAVARIVARFFEQRSAGQRVSVDAVLAGAPGGAAPALRAAVVSRIAAESRARSLSDASSGAAPGVDPAAPFPQLAGYDLVELIGRGGMGVVYEAYQQSTGRRVAVKFMLESAAASDSARRRFEREVELVARLEHPGIVAIVDSGAQRGQCYYVMEYVDGRPLDAALADETRVGRILDVLARVCDAVDYAHQRGVLHRDLKPSNILLDGRDEPHVLDFGLAKAIDTGSRVSRDLTLEGPQHLLGTLAYMSPEQSRGESAALSVRSDVYSLGAIGYELLTGGPPIGVDGSLVDVLSRIATAEPAAPSGAARRSAVASRASRAGGISRDVDAILLKALEKSPERRYATAAALADDLRRCLRDEPISARPAGAWLAFRKFARRNRAWVAGAAAALLLLLAGSAATTGQAIRATRAERTALAERDSARQFGAQAAREAARATAVREFLQRIFTAGNPMQGRGANLTVREALDDALLRMESELKDQPEIEAGVRRAIGGAYYGLGQSGEAVTQLRRACELQRRVAPDDEPERLEFERELGIVLAGDNQSEEAERILRRVLEGYRRRNGPQDLHTLRATADLVFCLDHGGRSAEAEQMVRPLIELETKLLGEDHPDRLYAATLLVSTLEKQGKELDAVAAAARRAYERQLSRDHPLTAELVQVQAGVARRKGDLAEAERLYREALARLRTSSGEEHAETDRNYRTLRDVLYQAYKLPAVEALCAETLSLRVAKLGADHPLTVAARFDLAIAQRSMMKPDAAMANFRIVLEQRRKSLGREHPDTLWPLEELGILLLNVRRQAEAEPLLAEGTRIAQQRFSRADARRSAAVFYHGRCLAELGRAKQAEPLLVEGYETAVLSSGPANPWTMTTVESLVRFYEWQGRPAEAERYRQLMRTPTSGPTTAPGGASDRPAASGPAPAPSGSRPGCGREFSVARLRQHSAGPAVGWGVTLAVQALTGRGSPARRKPQEARFRSGAGVNARRLPARPGAC